MKMLNSKCRCQDELFKACRNDDEFFAVHSFLTRRKDEVLPQYEEEYQQRLHRISSSDHVGEEETDTSIDRRPSGLHEGLDIASLPEEKGSEGGSQAGSMESKAPSLLSPSSVRTSVADVSEMPSLPNLEEISGEGEAYLNVNAMKEALKKVED
mmetsp:Transcript_33647/g.86203  ORF Transcript_33647/g.86203 Transcript_33647/m.86203 type:complete len:154 (+) Transcript_33647:2690-3151(+)